ncbi:MAG TPA: bZIP transcription factor [Rubrobacter sp.]|nr:bZIP transcription factor [Rubrobacter sp.]
MGRQQYDALSLEGLTRRLEALERENARLRNEVETLRDSGTHRAGEPAASELSEGEGRVSRKWLLSRAGVAAAGLVVAGALTQRDIRQTKADPTVFSTNTAQRGAVEGSNDNAAGYGVWGNAKNLGVYGSGGHTGILAISDPGAGVTTNQGAGIQASHTSNGPGVLADSEGGPGVQARSFGGTSGAVYGKHNAQGYGGLFEGGRAQLKLVPASSRGRPTGAHTKGELYMDSAGSLFVCVKGGTPGAWRKFATTRA